MAIAKFFSVRFSIYGRKLKLAATMREFMFKRATYLLNQIIATTIVVAAVGLLAFNGYQVYRYFVLIGFVDKALLACTVGEPLRAREHLFEAMDYAPDGEARDSVRITGRRIRYGDCGDGVFGF
jgi:hypothetical protein